MTTKVIYFSVSGRNEQAEFLSDDLPENVKAVFRAAAEAHEGDILKLYNSRGNLINISPSLPENSPDTRYKLEVVASNNSGLSIGTEVGFDFDDLQSRLQLLESKFVAQSKDAPDLVKDMKVKVEVLREKLENLDHLSWLGLYKDLSRSPSLQPFWSKLGHEAKTPEQFQRVRDKVDQIGQVQLTKDVRDYLKKLSFDNWQWDDSEMIILMRQMFIDLDLLAKFKIEMPVLTSWIFTIYKSYNDVPFHNFKHCFMVTQMMYGLIWLLNLTANMEHIDVFILLVSAICHDLDHPGYNNSYQINAQTELALRYNDISPLENHHCSVAFEILENKDVNIFRNFPPETYRRVREGMIKCILATDMAKHHEILKTFRMITPSFDWSLKEHKDLLMNILIKTADISNEVRPMDVADLWLECLLQEYFKQSDMEKLEGLPVAPFMDREKVTKPSSQIGFIRFILMPLIEALVELFPILQEEVMTPVQNALDYYTKMQQDLEMEKLRNDEQQQQQLPRHDDGSGRSLISSSNVPSGIALLEQQQAQQQAQSLQQHKFKVQKISKLSGKASGVDDEHQSMSSSRPTHKPGL
jgi:high affinity cGMP-specific 3',5'-cyclic phosphodiesterase 9